MTQQEILHNQTGTKPTEKNTQLFKTKQINGTPFQILNKDDKFQLTMNNYLLTEPMDTENEVLEYIEKNHWLLTLTITTICIELINKSKLQ